MSIADCFIRTPTSCAADGRCIVQQDRQNPTQTVCVPTNAPPVLSTPANIYDPEIQMLKKVIISLSGVDLGKQADGLLRKMYPPLVFYIDKKIRAEIGGLADSNVPWGTLADQVSRTILDELQNTTCVICLETVNDTEDKDPSSVIYPTCCGEQQIIHKSCFRTAVEQGGKCPFCRTAVSPGKLIQEEKRADQLVLYTQPFMRRWTGLVSLQTEEFRNHVKAEIQKHVDTFNRVWQSRRDQRRRDDPLNAMRSRQRATQWAMDHYATTAAMREEYRRIIDMYENDISQQVYRNLVRRRTLGMVTTRSDGSLDFSEGLIFFIMAIVSYGIIFHGHVRM